MIMALLLAAQAPQPEAYTPQEQRAVEATFVCWKRYLDSIPRRERRRRGEALLEYTYAACAGEEAALRALLRTRFNARSAEQLSQIVRSTTRDGMLRYIRR